VRIYVTNRELLAGPDYYGSIEEYLAFKYPDYKVAKIYFNELDLSWACVLHPKQFLGGGEYDVT